MFKEDKRTMNELKSSTNPITKARIIFPHFCRGISSANTMVVVGEEMKVAERKNMINEGAS